MFVAMAIFSRAISVKFCHLFQNLAYSYPFNNFIVNKDLDSESVFITKKTMILTMEYIKHQTSAVYYDGLIKQN